MVAECGGNQEVGQSLSADQQLPIPPVLYNDFQVLCIDLVVGEDELVELGPGEGSTAIQDGEDFSIDLHIAHQLQKQHHSKGSEEQSRYWVVS